MFGICVAKIRKLQIGDIGRHVLCTPYFWIDRKVTSTIVWNRHKILSRTLFPWETYCLALKLLLVFSVCVSRGAIFLCFYNHILFFFSMCRYYVSPKGSLVILSTERQQLFVCVAQNTVNKKTQSSSPFLVKSKGIVV